MSLSQHMQEIKNQLKKEFLDSQAQKQLKRCHKKGFSERFQLKIEKNKLLDDLLDLEKKPASSTKKVKFSKGKIDSSSPMCQINC